MPAFDDGAVIDRPPEEVWKWLHDPARMPEWFAGVASVENVQPSGDATDFTLYPEGYPDFPMAQQLRTSGDGRRITISCLVSFLEFEWTLEEADGDATRVTVRVEIPEVEAHRLDDQRAAVRASLEKLTTVALRG
ncbi:MAG: hypothetical protein QOF76_5462 [Solirubrobacteraceae bacterium]|jgi:uncharacterized protein YndB with AHSA1/START domain|nr:hypothetical protein [Solirubrobacteraceae bacterium]